MSKEVNYFGSCHCGAVKWSVKAPEAIEAIICNCSVCTKKQNHHFIVSSENFSVLQGESDLVNYRFNEKVAQHKFCKHCGVQSFYHPRSNPDSIAVMPHCIDSPPIKKLTFRNFDGQNWETEMQKHAPVAYKFEKNDE